MKFEFIDYVRTPTEKHLGVATVKLYDKVIARYKVVPKKDGSGYFIASTSLKIDENYVTCIMLDSNSDNEELMNFIRSHVGKAMSVSGEKTNEIPF